MKPDSRAVQTTYFLLVPTVTLLRSAKTSALVAVVMGLKVAVTVAVWSPVLLYSALTAPGTVNRLLPLLGKVYSAAEVRLMTAL